MCVCVCARAHVLAAPSSPPTPKADENPDAWGGGLAPLILNACAWRAKGAVSQSRPERPCRPCALTRARLYVCAGQVSPQRSAKMDTSDLQGVALKAFSFGKQLVKQGCVAPRGSMRACLACGRLPCAGLAHGRWKAGSATGRAGVSAMPPALCESACVCVCVCVRVHARAHNTGETWR